MRFINLFALVSTLLFFSCGKKEQGDVTTARLVMAATAEYLGEYNRVMIYGINLDTFSHFSTSLKGPTGLLAQEVELSNGNWQFTSVAWKLDSSMVCGINFSQLQGTDISIELVLDSLTCKQRPFNQTLTTVTEERLAFTSCSSAETYRPILDPLCSTNKGIVGSVKLVMPEFYETANGGDESGVEYASICYPLVAGQSTRTLAFPLTHPEAIAGFPLKVRGYTTNNCSGGWKDYYFEEGLSRGDSALATKSDLTNRKFLLFDQGTPTTVAAGSEPLELELSVSTGVTYNLDKFFSGVTSSTTYLADGNTVGKFFTPSTIPGHTVQAIQNGTSAPLELHTVDAYCSIDFTTIDYTTTTWMYLMRTTSTGIATKIGLTGLIESVGSSEARHDRDPLNPSVSKGLLLESASANLFHYSEDINVSAVNSNIQVNKSSTAGPDGSASKAANLQDLDVASVGQIRWVLGEAVVAGDNLLVSAFVRPIGSARALVKLIDPGSNCAGIRINANGVLESESTCTKNGVKGVRPFPGGWWRVWFSMAITAAGPGSAVKIEVSPDIGASGVASITATGASQIYGIQVEKDRMAPSSLILTNGVAGTRGEDQLNFISSYNEYECLRAVFAQGLQDSTLLMNINFGDYSYAQNGALRNLFHAEDSTYFYNSYLSLNLNSSLLSLDHDAIAPLNSTLAFPMTGKVTVGLVLTPEVRQLTFSGATGVTSQQFATPFSRPLDYNSFVIKGFDGTLAGLKAYDSALSASAIKAIIP